MTHWTIVITNRFFTAPAAPERPAAVSPWLESNAGLVTAIGVVLSVLAVVVALIAIVLQVRSDALAQARRQREFVETVTGVCDEVIKVGRSKANALRVSFEDVGFWPVSEFRECCTNAGHTLEAIRGVQLGSAALALKTTELYLLFASGFQGTSPIPAPDREADDIEKKLERIAKLRNEIEEIA